MRLICNQSLDAYKKAHHPGGMDLEAVNSAALAVVVTAMTFVVKPGLVAQTVVVYLFGSQLDHVSFSQWTPPTDRLPETDYLIRQLGDRQISSAPVRSAMYASVRLTCEDVSPSRA